jgi:hypothetical protein
MHDILMHTTPLDLRSVVIAVSFAMMLIAPCLIAMVGGETNGEQETE